MIYSFWEFWDSITPFETADLQKLVNYNFNMPDRDNTYSTNQIRKISQCHSSLGTKTRVASPKLDRWKDLNKAIVDWINNDALEETSVKIAEENNFQFYDSIQKRILSDLFSRFRTIYPKKDYKFEHEYLVKEAVKELNGEEYGLTTHFTYEFEDENQFEYIRLKTAHDPEPELIDRAIITKLRAENEEFYTAAIELDDLIEIEQVENPDEIINEYFTILEEYLTNRKKRTPGRQCDYCDQVSRCGQFPLITDDKITNRVREVKISKTNLVKLSNCERRTAWNVQYGLPREDYIEFESESDGTKFHNFSQKLLVNNNNFLEKENIESFNQLTNQEDEVTREQLFLKYQQLVSKLKNYKDLKIKESEYILGFTCIAEGRGLRNGKVVDQKVATIFTGKSDLAGRVGDTPIIIELKTRQEIPEDALEAQLYALGASQLMKSEKEIIVLHIYVSDHDATIKERKFGSSELESAKAKFDDLAKKSASWIPYDALSPKYSIGIWCEVCEFKSTCLENR